MKKIGFKLFILCSVVICFMFIVLSLPYFSITDILVQGNSKVETKYIKELIGVDGENIFIFNKNKSEKLLSQNPYISEVVITKRYPKTVIIAIKERRPSAYIEDTPDSFLYIDENGMVLDVLNQIKDNLPIIVGLKFSKYSIGDILKVENMGSFETIVTLARLFNEYDMSKEIAKVDVTNENDIHLYIYQIDVVFGSVLEADFKLREIKAILQEIPNVQEIKAILRIEDNTYEMLF